MAKSYEIRKGANGLEIIGPTPGTLVKAYSSEKAKHFLKLSIARSMLGTAKACMEMVPKIEDDSSVLIADAMANHAATKYFGCFLSGRLSPKLSPNKVYKHKPEALQRHRDWKRFRDHRYNHPDNVFRTSETALLYNEDEDSRELVTFIMDSPLGSHHSWLQILYQLVCHTIDYLEGAMDDAIEAARPELEKLTSKEINALPDLTAKKPAD